MFERPSQRMSAAVGTDPSCIAQESPLLMCSLSLSKHIFFKIQSRLLIYISNENHMHRMRKHNHRMRKRKTHQWNEKDVCTLVPYSLRIYWPAEHSFSSFFDTSTKNNICIICAPLGSVRTAASLPPSAVLHTFQK